VTAADQRAIDPMPKCCATHPDWETLRQHLVRSYAALPEDTVTAALARAREATDYVALPLPDQLETAELICRHELGLMLGETRDNARLDPETRPRHGAAE
jgi:hypothetical protein